MAHELLDVGFPQLFALGFKLPLGVLFGGEDLHHLHAGDVLGNEGVELGHLGPDGPVHLSGDLGEHKGGDHRKGDDGEDGQGQAHVVVHHGLHNAHQDKDVLHHGDDHRGEHFQNGLAVVGDTGHQTADGVVVEKADVQGGQVVEDVGAHVVDDLLAHHGQQGGLDIGEAEDQRHRQQIFAAQEQDAPEVGLLQFIGHVHLEAVFIHHHVLCQIAVGGLGNELGLPQLQLDGGENHQKDQKEPADIGLAVFQKAADNVAVDHGVILLVTHNAYSSFFIFSSS